MKSREHIICMLLLTVIDVYVYSDEKHEPVKGYAWKVCKL